MTDKKVYQASSCKMIWNGMEVTSYLYTDLISIDKNQDISDLITGPDSMTVGLMADGVNANQEFLKEMAGETKLQIDIHVHDKETMEEIDCIIQAIEEAVEQHTGNMPVINTIQCYEDEDE